MVRGRETSQLTNVQRRQQNSLLTPGDSSHLPRCLAGPGASSRAFCPRQLCFFASLHRRTRPLEVASSLVPPRCTQHRESVQTPKIDAFAATDKRVSPGEASRVIKRREKSVMLEETEAWRLVSLVSRLAWPLGGRNAVLQ